MRSPIRSLGLLIVLCAGCSATTLVAPDAGADASRLSCPQTVAECCGAYPAGTPSGCGQTWTSVQADHSECPPNNRLIASWETCGAYHAYFLIDIDSGDAYFYDGAGQLVAVMLWGIGGITSCRGGPQEGFAAPACQSTVSPCSIGGADAG